MKYLLPCEQCGRQHEVDTGRAGEKLRCSCGRELEIPSLRGLRALERAAAPAESTTTSTTAAASRGKVRPAELARRIICVLGLIALALGLTVAAYGALVRSQIRYPGPPEDTSQQAEAAIDSASPRQILELWSAYRDQGLGPYELPIHQLGEFTVQHYTRIAIGGLILAGLGLLVAIAAVLAGRKTQTPGGR